MAGSEEVRILAITKITIKKRAKQIPKDVTLHLLLHIHLISIMIMYILHIPNLILIQT